MQNFLHCFLPLKVHLIFYLFFLSLSLFLFPFKSLSVHWFLSSILFLSNADGSFSFNISSRRLFCFFFFQSLNLAYFITLLSHALFLFSFSPSPFQSLSLSYSFSLSPSLSLSLALSLFLSLSIYLSISLNL